MSELMPSVERLKDLLVGRAIEKTETVNETPRDESGWSSGLPPIGVITLDDGTVLKVWGHEGGCACSSGDYVLNYLGDVENVITDVRVLEAPAGDDHVGAPDDKYVDDWTGFYRIFVYAGYDWQKLASFEGSDGNGYYGTGWYLEVSE